MKIPQIQNKFFSNPEAKILLIGIFFVLFAFFVLIIIYFIDIQLANTITAMIATNLFVGRVPSLSLGYASELSHMIVIGTNLVTEMLLVLLLYPLFILSFNNILHVKFLEDFFNDIKAYRIKYKDLFDKYGIFGLSVFVFFPFWMTGPIVGSIIGYLIGLPSKTVISIVFISTAIAISIWGIFLSELVEILNNINSDVVPILVVGSIGIYLIYRFFKSHK